MVQMGDPFTGNVSKKLSKDELVQALRVDIAGELEAIVAYDAHVMATDDQRAKAILYSIRDEERQHVGELIHLIEIMDPQEAQFLSKGKQEVDQLLSQKGQYSQQAQAVKATQQTQYGQQTQQGQQIPQTQYGQSPFGNLGPQGPHNWQ